MLERMEKEFLNGVEWQPLNNSLNHEAKKQTSPTLSCNSDENPLNNEDIAVVNGVIGAENIENVGCSGSLSPEKNESEGSYGHADDVSLANDPEIMQQSPDACSLKKR